jgi:thymidylate synthase (FAD)
MRIIKSSYSIETPIGPELLKRIEQAGRTCYKSENRIVDGSELKFVAMLIKRGHHAMLEFGGHITVRFICDRGVSHETVRHRLFSFAQESTRFCNYLKEQFGSELTIIDISSHCTEQQWEIIKEAGHISEALYFKLLELGATPNIARAVLMNILKTEIVVQGNTREWRHFFTMRAATPAHPQMRELACPLLREFRERVPVLFDDTGDLDCV